MGFAVLFRLLSPKATLVLVLLAGALPLYGPPLLRTVQELPVWVLAVGGAWIGLNVSTGARAPAHRRRRGQWHGRRAGRWTGAAHPPDRVASSPGRAGTRTTYYPLGTVSSWVGASAHLRRRGNRLETALSMGEIQKR